MNLGSSEALPKDEFAGGTDMPFKFQILDFGDYFYDS